MTTRGGLQDNNNDTDSSTNSELELIALCYYYYEWRFIQQEILFFFGEQKWTKTSTEKEAKEDKKTNEREKKQRSPLRLINHHKTHTLSYTLYIYLKHHGHHVREIVPAPLFEEGNAHFDGAFGRRSGFSVVCLAVSFFLFHFFSTARNSFALSFLWAKEQRERGEIFESR